MDKKEQTKIRKIAEVIFHSNREISRLKISREDQREILRNYGIIEFNQGTIVELYFLYLFASLKGIWDDFGISKNQKEAITEELFTVDKENFSYLNEEEYWQYYLLQNKRLESYEKIFKLIHYENENPFRSCEMLFNIWEPFIKADANKKNIYDSLPLVLLFSNTILNYALIIAKMINEFK